MSYSPLVNITELKVKYNLQIDNMLPDKLRCAKCRSALRDACQGPCGCRLCRVCIDDALTSGDQFCPGPSHGCGRSFLSKFVTDYIANNSISKFTIQCPRNGCLHECQLASLEDHLRVCSKRTEKCPFRELGCTLDQLAPEEIGGHLQQENRRHSEILIGAIANINREIELLKQRDEHHKREIETLKRDLELKDERIQALLDHVLHVENENKTIKADIKSIKEDLIDRVRILSGKIEQEIDERRESDELDSARVIDHVDREIATVTEFIGSNKDEVVKEMKSISDEIRSINHDTKSLNISVYEIKSNVQSIQALVRLRQIDASCEWIIGVDVAKTTWEWGDKTSVYFSEMNHPYKYRLNSRNKVRKIDGSLWIELDLIDELEITRPFRRTVVMTFADLYKREASRSIVQQNWPLTPLRNSLARFDNAFVLSHNELIGAGVDLSHGVIVSCAIDSCGDA